jgi:hypothetical protein
MAQPNKVDFVVREVLKRKKVSRDRMALPEHSEAMLHQKIQTRTSYHFCAPVSSEDNVVIENSKDSANNNDSNTNLKIVNPT